MINKLRVFEAFSGYGSQSIALRNIGVPHKVVAISEIDKYAIKAYESIHGKVNNLGDISKINIEDIPEHDLFTYSFPCQDISVAGLQKGIEKNKTRSGLLYECEKIIEHCKPKYLLMENVKNLVGKKFKPQFDKWLEYLSSLGYTNYWKVLNAKDYGIPQNRERVFVVSILGEHKPYEFPKKLELTKKLKDILEEETDNKHHLSDNTIKKIIVVDKNIKPSVRLNFEREKNEISKSDKEIYQCKCNSGWQDNKVGIKVAPTLRANNPHTCIYSDFRIKKLTPKECFRLMGMDDNDIQKIIDSGISNTQQYKLAGNSIVINVLEYIFKNLFIS
jgi:DNA (cytosine-5)-methyltransferase 1